MDVTVLAGGVGGSRFLRGVRAALRGVGGPAVDDARITAVVNTGDDMWLAGLRIAPDLDTITYALAGVNDEERGWGRVGETERVAAELAAFGVGWPWFTLGDLDLGTHIARTAFLRDGLPLSEATRRITARWSLGDDSVGVRLLPATDEEVETHVVTDDGELHFEEWWTRLRAASPARAFVQTGVERAVPAPGVLEAIAGADVVLLAPSNPVVSIGTILGIPGIRDAVATTTAPVVGVSPIIGGAVVRGMADACLAAIGVQTDATAVARHYGARTVGGRAAGGLLDGWLVDEVDAVAVEELAGDGIPARALPLRMRDEETSAAIARAALELATARR
jgi:LPPG:FO 2-phospho-L-lactate transferase